MDAQPQHTSDDFPPDIGGPYVALADLLRTVRGVVAGNENEVNGATWGHGVRLEELTALTLRFAGHGSSDEGWFDTARRLFEDGYPIEVVALVVDTPTGALADSFRRRRVAPRSPEVLGLHRAGRTVRQISAETLISSTRVYEILGRAEAKPHTTRRRVHDELREEAVRMYRAGSTLRDIRDELSLRRDQLLNVLRAAHKRGDCPEYGEQRRALLQRAAERRALLEEAGPDA